MLIKPLPCDLAKRQQADGVYGPLQGRQVSDVGRCVAPPPHLRPGTPVVASKGAPDRIWLPSEEEWGIPQYLQEILNSILIIRLNFLGFWDCYTLEKKTIIHN